MKGTGLITNNWFQVISFMSIIVFPPSRKGVKIETFVRINCFLTWSKTVLSEAWKWASYFASCSITFKKKTLLLLFFLKCDSNGKGHKEFSKHNAYLQQELSLLKWGFVDEALNAISIIMSQAVLLWKADCWLLEFWSTTPICQRTWFMLNYVSLLAMRLNSLQFASFYLLVCGSTVGGLI